VLKSFKSLGTAKQLPSLHQVLRQADFVTLHVPELPETKNMISHAEFEVMKVGSYIINASRGTVVDIPALIDARRSGKIAGFALDVYPNEPAKNGQYFENYLNEWALNLRNLTNIIITPHIGGSTEEAQSMIGVEVADFLIKCNSLYIVSLTGTDINEGNSIGAVNFPEVSLRSLTIDEENHARVCVVHHNMAGALREFNNIFSEVGINVDKQFSDSRYLFISQFANLVGMMWHT
jgi:D-3-phosphoglycerate dehydrogenase / 2-oxoglutarate reductase